MLDEIIVGVLSGIFSGLGVTVVSFYIWRSQRLWERRGAGYKAVLEALQAMKAANDEEYNDEITYKNMPEARQIELADTWRANKVIVYRFADIGALETDEKVEEPLNTLRNDLENHSQFHSRFEDLDHCGAAITRAMTAVKNVALEDARGSIFRKVPSWLAAVLLKAPF